MNDSVSSLVTTKGPLATLLAATRIRVAEMDPRQLPENVSLFPEEQKEIAAAVRTRREQFTAGRCLARHAWRELGVPPSALLNDADRVPMWPSGLVGTITHTHLWCAVAVARKEDVARLGADVEPRTALGEELWMLVCRPEEREFLKAQPEPLAGLLAKTLFSAKESIYKALYPDVRVFLDFQAMSISLRPANGEAAWIWDAELQIPWGPFSAGQRFGPGKAEIGREVIVTAVMP